MRLAVAAGIDALRDAGIPLVRRYRVTSTGSRLPVGWSLPESLRDDTAVVFGSAFPGLDQFAHARAHLFPADRFAALGFRSSGEKISHGKDPVGSLHVLVRNGTADGRGITFQFRGEVVHPTNLQGAGALIEEIALLFGDGLRNLQQSGLAKLHGIDERGSFIDVKSQFDLTTLQRAGLTVWRL